MTNCSTIKTTSCSDLEMIATRTSNDIFDAEMKVIENSKHIRKDCFGFLYV